MAESTSLPIVTQNQSADNPHIPHPAARPRLRVLVGCESSGIVRDAFAAVGCDAWSCDLAPTERPGNHYQCDIRDVLDYRWDIAIFHPPCTYLANSGSKHLYNGMSKAGGINPERWRNMLDGVAFFKLLRAANIPRIAIENPVMHEHARKRIGYPSQYVQPWYFGDNETKLTGLWLKNLPRLVPTNIIEGVHNHSIHNEPPGPERQINRSRTFPGIAQAMAHRWGLPANDDVSDMPLFTAARSATP